MEIANDKIQGYFKKEESVLLKMYRDASDKKDNRLIDFYSGAIIELNYIKGFLGVDEVGELPPDPLERLEKHIRKHHSIEELVKETDDDFSYTFVDRILNLIVALRKDSNTDLDDPSL
jgi:hypothetical protein